MITVIIIFHHHLLLAIIAILLLLLNGICLAVISVHIVFATSQYSSCLFQSQDFWVKGVCCSFWLGLSWGPTGGGTVKLA